MREQTESGKGAVKFRRTDGMEQDKFGDCSFMMGTERNDVNL